MTTYSPPTEHQPQAPPDQLERGWRYVRVRLPDGREESQIVLLTSADFLNPQEGDVMPQRPFHQQTIHDLAAALHNHYANQPAMTVFCDLIMDWGMADLPNPSPDIALVPDVRDPQADRGRFYVQQEGTRPMLVIEVVSPLYRKEDREEKVDIYARAGVREYVILDHRQRRGVWVDETLGYRLVGDHYRPISTDEDGFVYCETVDLRIGLENGRAVVEDGQTGQRLLTARELATAHRAAEARAEAETARADIEAARADAEAAACAQAEARLAELEATLKQLRDEA